MYKRRWEVSAKLAYVCRSLSISTGSRSLKPTTPGPLFARQLHLTGEWLKAPPGNVALIVIATLVLRLLFAASLGLGIDESYMVAAGRNFQLSYFDHPPLAWWMAWAATHVAGTDAAWAVRLPFVLTFALTTWLMFRLTSRLFSARAGLWSAAFLNAAPVFGVTTGSWVLPDGPLIAALLAAAICFVEALDRSEDDAWGWWSAVGLCAGIAMLSKYSAVLTIAGAVLFLLTTASARHWLARPHPYVASIIALTIFSPVVIWNAEHGWVSLLFQGGRAGLGRMHLLGPFSTLAGEALFLLPWIWLALISCGFLAVRRRPRDDRSWLLVCLALPPIVLFTLISLWTHVLFHWAAPGYLMLFPLLGKTLDHWGNNKRAVRIGLGASAAFVLVAMLFVASEVKFNWLPNVFENFAPGKDPDLEAVDWTSVRVQLNSRGLLLESGRVVAATRWFDAGKLDYALGGEVKVICLGLDPREYGVTTDMQDFIGRDILIVAPRTTLGQITTQFGGAFDEIVSLSPVELVHAGRPAMTVPLYIGRHLRGQSIADPLGGA